MKKLAPLLLLICGPVWAEGFWADSIFPENFWAEGIFEAESIPTVTVPDVVGEASYAAADSILEGVGLDGGAAVVTCSAATVNEIVSQNPAAGTEIAISTAVDLVSSSGSGCPNAGGLTISPSLRID